MAIERLTTSGIAMEGVQIPTMSEVAATFAVEIIERNRRRLLDAC